MPRKKKKDSFLLPILAAAIFAAGFVAFYVSTSKTATDDDTGCALQTDNLGSALTILLDSTEPYSAVQLKQVSNRIVAAVEGLRPLDRVRIYTVWDASEKLLAPYFDFCKPDPNANESPILSRFKLTNFTFKLEEDLKKMQGSRSNSPIISSLGSVAADLSGAYENRRIILVSDLIENSEIISMYPSDWLATAERKKRNIAAKRPMLSGIHLEVLFIPRPNQPQQDVALRDWWWSFIEDSGGSVARFTPISG